MSVIGVRDRSSAELDPTFLAYRRALEIALTPTVCDIPGEAPADPLSGEATNPHLGLQHGVSGSPVGRTGPLDLDSPKELSLWSRLAVRAGLVGAGPHARDAKCCRTRFKTSADVVAKRSAAGRWSLTGIIKCGHWTCPNCGPVRSRSTAAHLAVAFRKHLATRSVENYVWPDVWMLSLTIPHKATDPVAETVARLYAASGGLWLSKAWRNFVDRWGIVAKVRVLDSTHGGENGSHPHFHIALFPTWSSIPSYEIVAPDRLHETLPELPLGMAKQDVRERFLAELSSGLVAAWEQCVRDVGCQIDRPDHFRQHAVRLSPSEKAAAYFLKWGLADEIGQSTAKAKSHLRLLDLAGAGTPVTSDRAGDTYLRWREGTAGRAWVTGLTDTCKKLGVTDEEADAYLAEIRQRHEDEQEKLGTPLERKRELSILLRSHLYESALRLGWDAVFAFIDTVAERELDDRRLQIAIDDHLFFNQPIRRSSA